MRKYFLNNLEYSGNSFIKNLGIPRNIVHIKNQSRNPNCELNTSSYNRTIT